MVLFTVDRIEYTLVSFIIGKSFIACEFLIAARRYFRHLYFFEPNDVIKSCLYLTLLANYFGKSYLIDLANVLLDEIVDIRTLNMRNLALN